MKKILLLGLLLIVLINLPPLKLIFGQEDLLYSNSNGSFTFDEMNYTGRNYNLCIDNFGAFKEIHRKDTILYRVTPVNILKFWLWAEFLTNKKYKLPYKSWKDVEAIRGPISNRTNWQAF